MLSLLNPNPTSLFELPSLPGDELRGKENSISTVCEPEDVLLSVCACPFSVFTWHLFSYSEVAFLASLMTNVNRSGERCFTITLYVGAIKLTFFLNPTWWSQTYNFYTSRAPRIYLIRQRGMEEGFTRSPFLPFSALLLLAWLEHSTLGKVGSLWSRLNDRDIRSSQIRG